MAGLNKDDLRQMSRSYFQSLSKEKLVEVADNLHILVVEQWEKINSNSGNSSQPPSVDNPFEKPKKSLLSIDNIAQEDSKSELSKKKKSSIQAVETKQNRKPGRQKGSKGFGRSQLLKVSSIIPHYPNQCSACNQTIENDPKPYMGHRVLELEKTDKGLKIVCQLHHYYQGTCSCGHQSKSRPGVGIKSQVEGRTRDLVLTEYVLVASNLASLHIDETPWYESGKLYWLWVAIESKTAVFRVAPRTKEEFKHLVRDAFVGWLITDGYIAYRHIERRSSMFSPSHS